MRNLKDFSIFELFDKNKSDILKIAQSKDIDISDKNTDKESILAQFLKNDQVLLNTISNMTHIEQNNKKCDVNKYISYLQKKYNQCAIYSNDCEFKFIGKEKPIAIGFFKIGEDGSLISQRAFAKEALDKCESRFFVVSIGLIILNRGGNHQNVLIYDKIDKTVERFEPHGAELPKFTKIFGNIDGYIEKYATFNNEYKYIPTTMFCPYISFQSEQEDQLPLSGINYTEESIDSYSGFCRTWSVFYVHMRFNYPEIERKNLVNLLLNDLKSENYMLTYFIVNYSKYLNDNVGC
jgi:hypothetical protein